MNYQKITELTRISGTTKDELSIVWLCKLFHKFSLKMQAARNWLLTFVHWYNEELCHSGIEFVTSGSRHRVEDVAILAAREELHLAAKTRHPERLSKEIKCLMPEYGVWLNPDKVIHNVDETEEQVA